MKANTTKIKTKIRDEIKKCKDATQGMIAPSLNARVFALNARMFALNWVLNLIKSVEQEEIEDEYNQSQ